MKLRSVAVDDPLPVVWSPPGPFNVEVDDLGMGFDSVALKATLLEASRHASRMLRRDWGLRGDSRRIRIEGAGIMW